MTTIKVGYMPGTLSEVAFEGTKTVEEVLAIGSIANKTGYEAKIDGTPVSLDATVPASARVLVLTKKVKGNADLIIKVGYMPGTLKEMIFPSPQTVHAILKAAGLNPTGYEAKLDGAVVSLDAEITSGRVLVLAKKVKGNA